MTCDVSIPSHARAGGFMTATSTTTIECQRDGVVVTTEEQRDQCLRDGLVVTPHGIAHLRLRGGFVAAPMDVGWTAAGQVSAVKSVIRRPAVGVQILRSVTMRSKVNASTASSASGRRNRDTVPSFKLISR
jgi:hypothetical protein